MDTLTLFDPKTKYLGEEKINGIACSMGYIQEFRLSWFATQLNAFVLIGEAPGKITKQTIADFSAACFEYALNNNKGLPRGIFSAICSIAILQGDEIEKEALGFCTGQARKHWSAFEVPVLYDTAKAKAIRFKNYPYWGKVFYPFFAKTIDSVVKSLVLVPEK